MTYKKKKLVASLLCDFYKVSHREMYPENTGLVYSTWTPRVSRKEGIDEVVVFGLQAFIKDFLMEFFDKEFFQLPVEEVVYDYERVLKYALGIKEPYSEHIRELHQLGYLPISIRSLPEGTVAPLRVPTMTIHNTIPKFFWVTNYLETLSSCEFWQAQTSATLALQYRKIFEKYAMMTVGETSFVPFQGHDFSMRGMGGLFSAIKSGMGHLAAGFVGTDTIPAITTLEYSYNADIEKELVGTSIPASEHSIQCAYGDDMEYFRHLITKVHPDGFVSLVSDGYDFWDVIGRVIPELKNLIMEREGKVVIRPDSGDPVLIVCGDPTASTPLERAGLVQALWNIFSGTETKMGFKLLDSHIGSIYGDAITLERAERICSNLAEKGFASINVVFGIGSYTYQYNTRDTFGFAIKSTLCAVNGVERQIFKDPKTDDGTKKSQKGRVIVLKDLSTGKIRLQDELGLPDVAVDDDMLIEVFRDGKLLVDEYLANIRQRITDHLVWKQCE